MSEKEIMLSLAVVAFLLYLVYAIYKSVQENKEEQEREKNLELYEIEKKEKEIKKRKEYSVRWNKKIQSQFNKTILYKTNRPVKVLLGDYHSGMAPFSNSVLRTMGIETEVVPSASDIIDRIQEGKKYDLIITNNTYPKGECGMDVLLLKEIAGFNIPIVVLTTEMKSRNRFLDYGFDEYIEKPLDEKKVKDVFKKLLKDLKFSKIKSNKS